MFIAITLPSVAAALAVLAVATPTSVGELAPASQCNTQPVQCCRDTFTEGSAFGTALLRSLTIPIQDVNALVGQGCSPVSVVGVASSAECSASPMCCADNSHGAVLSIGCVPVNINL